MDYSDLQTSSAQRIPSAAAERMPPAQPRPLSAGVQPPDGGLTGFVPQQPHRGGTAAFHGGEHRVRLVVAFQLPSQNGQRFGKGRRHKVRQAVPKIPPGHPGTVAGNHPSRPGGGTVQQEVLHPLGRGEVPPAAGAERRVLQPALEGDTRQRAFSAKVLRRDAHQQGAVDVFPVPGKFAHAVGNHPPCLRRGGHHLTAGADAEGEDTPAVGQMAA